MYVLSRVYPIYSCTITKALNQKKSTAKHVQPVLGGQSWESRPSTLNDRFEAVALKNQKMTSSQK